MNEKIDALLRAALRDLGDELGKPEIAAAGDELRLFGAQSPLDSMALVSLIADVEGRLAHELGVQVVLADEKAMSQARSPFRSVASLREHIVARVNENSSAA